MRITKDAPTELRLIHSILYPCDRSQELEGFRCPKFQEGGSIMSSSPSHILVFTLSGW